MAKNFKQELAGVFGYPVDENPTVVIQDAAFEATNLFWHYLTLLVNPEDLGDAMQSIRALNLKEDLVVCDVIPNPRETLFLKEAERLGAAKTICGQGMLVYQGAIGFKIWTGVEAPISAMKNAIQKAFNDN